MQNLIPQYILEKYARGESLGQFPAVSLFADISGFSAVTNTLVPHGSAGAEAMAAVMLDIFEPLVQHIHAHGGFIATFAGDAFTALFPNDGKGESQTCPYHRTLAAPWGSMRCWPRRARRRGQRMNPCWAQACRTS